MRFGFLNNEALPKAATGMVGARGDDDNGGVRDEVRGQEREEFLEVTQHRSS